MEGLVALRYPRARRMDASLVGRIPNGSWAARLLAHAYDTNLPGRICLGRLSCSGPCCSPLASCPRAQPLSSSPFQSHAAIPSSATRSQRVGLTRFFPPGRPSACVGDWDTMKVSMDAYSTRTRRVLDAYSWHWRTPPCCPLTLRGTPVDQDLTARIQGLTMLLQQAERETRDLVRRA
jgi:hypothetical protein